MSSFKITSLVLVLSLALSGCVSKKKYTAMVASKDKYQKEANKMKAENADLRKNLQTAESDFKSIKDQLFASDAAKNDALTQLQQQLSEVEKSYDLLKSDLSKTQSQVKDQRYFNAKASSEIARLEIEVKQLARDTASLNYSLKLARQRVDEYKEQSMDKTNDIIEANSNINELKKDITSKDDEIANLQAAVDAETAKVNAVKNTFVELRKEMLRAYADGKAIDPNANSTVNEIGKKLESY